MRTRMENAEAPAEAAPILHRAAAGLALGLPGMAPAHMLRADFSRLLPRLHPHRLSRELLVRAAKLRHHSSEPLALDATAGLGEDALVLAAAGFRVDVYESNPLTAALLADGLERAASVPELAAICARMLLHEADSVQAMREWPQNEPPPDVVLLDPMFPARKKSALVKKKLQLLQMLESPCADEAALLDAALALGPRKIVIKRPRTGPPLAGITPTYSLVGRAVRFDCLVCPPR